MFARPAAVHYDPAECHLDRAVGGDCLTGGGRAVKPRRSFDQQTGNAIETVRQPEPGDPFASRSPRGAVIALGIREGDDPRALDNVVQRTPCREIAHPAGGPSGAGHDDVIADGHAGNRVRQHTGKVAV